MPNDIIPKNPKYAGVQSKIDSGATIDKFYKQHSMGQLNSVGSRKVTAGFKRIRLSTLAKWMECAMVVLSEPDYIDSGESIYDLAGLPNQVRENARSAVESASMAGTEATVCGEEPGVPPMYMFGPDIADEDEIQQAGRIGNKKEMEESFRPNQPAGPLSDQQIKQQFNETSAANRTFANKNRSSQFSIEEVPAGQTSTGAPTTLSYVQQLTTRARHQKLIDRIHLKPNLQLEIYANSAPSDSNKRLLPVPCATKQFVIVDMRDDPQDFARCHLWGSVHLPVALLHRVGARMPGPLHYFAKFEESIFVVVGLTGPALENALNQLVDYGIARKNVVPLIQTLEEALQEHPNLFIQE